MRVPLVFAGPGVASGARADGLCHLHDVFPTVCALAGFPVPATVEGRSLAAALRDPAAPLRDHVFAAYRDVQRMVRTDRWKLIWYPKAGRTQLFDLAADPDERENLAGRGEHAATLADLRARLAECQAAAGDPGPRAA